jgi:hypothetical protein
MAALQAASKCSHTLCRLCFFIGLRLALEPNQRF